MMIKQMSNRLLSKLDKSRYQILATIPEDPFYWTDRDCYAFQMALADHVFFLDGNPSFDVYETYETVADWSKMHEKNEKADGFIDIKDGYRHLIVLRNPSRGYPVSHATIVALGALDGMLDDGFDVLLVSEGNEFKASALNLGNHARFSGSSKEGWREALVIAALEWASDGGIGATHDEA